jgi:hypothetical protein
MATIMAAGASRYHRAAETTMRARPRASRARVPFAGGVRRTDRQETTTRDAALRRGRAATAIAAAAALIYPAIRLPWLAGVPIGMDAETFAQGCPEELTSLLARAGGLGGGSVISQAADASGRAHRSPRSRG